MNFAVTSPVNLFRSGELIGHWEEGKWPEPAFYEILNTKITRCETKSDRLIEIAFSNGIEMHLVDDSDQYECMHISFKGTPSTWII